MTEAVLEKMRPLWTKFEAALRIDLSYSIALAQAGSTQIARRDAKKNRSTLGREGRDDV
jgi:hypothetical protein